MISAKISMLIKNILNHPFHQVSIHLHSLSQIRALGTPFSITGHKCLSGHKLLILSRIKNKTLKIHMLFHAACTLLQGSRFIIHVVFRGSVITSLVLQSYLQLFSQPLKRTWDPSMTSCYFPHPDPDVRWDKGKYSDLSFLEFPAFRLRFHL